MFGNATRFQLKHLFERHRADEVLRSLLGQAPDELGFAAKVVVQTRLTEPQTPRQLAQGSSCDAALGNQLECDFEDFREAAAVVGHLSRDSSKTDLFGTSSLGHSFVEPKIIEDAGK